MGQGYDILITLLKPVCIRAQEIAVEINPGKITLLRLGGLEEA